MVDAIHEETGGIGQLVGCLLAVVVLHNVGGVRRWSRWAGGIEAHVIRRLGNIRLRSWCLAATLRTSSNNTSSLGRICNWMAQMANGAERLEPPDQSLCFQPRGAHLMHSRYLRAVRRNAVPIRTLHLYYNSSLEFSSLQPRSLAYSFFSGIFTLLPWFLN